jgi:hypothetical protein
VQSRAAALGWTARGSYNAKPVHSYLARRLRLFANTASVSDLYSLVIILEPSLYDKGFKIILKTLLRLLRKVAVVACRDVVGYLTIVDTFLGVKHTKIRG